MDEKMKEVGEIIRKAREQKRWTQEHMADKMGISMRQYNKYEAGKLPKYKTTVIEEIDRLLGTQIKELIYEQNVPRATKDGPSVDPQPPTAAKDIAAKETVVLPASMLQTLVESNRALA